MLRIAIAIGLSGLLVACGEPSRSAVEGAAPTQLDYIDAVPLDKSAPIPVARSLPVARKEEAEKSAEPAAEVKIETQTAPAAPAAPPTPRPTPPVDDAAAATRRANEAVAPRSPTEVPYSPN